MLYSVDHCYQLHMIFTFFPFPYSLLPAPCSLLQSVEFSKTSKEKKKIALEILSTAI
ncbi:hypothetical protein [Moorena producens]|uniref:hypothetical protein n=1 Tax=Moorena producens TaxID=1155739 RepID=UPI001314F356|nr:hypothetical protein [Moorena producens]